MMSYDCNETTFYKSRYMYKDDVILLQMRQLSIRQDTCIKQTKMIHKFLVLTVPHHFFKLLAIPKWPYFIGGWSLNAVREQLTLN